MALNYYRLLGIPPDADQQRIKSVYRSLAKRFHPDANRGSETAAELFRQVNTAYRVLSDPAARARYDRKLARQQAEEDKQQPAQPKPRSRKNTEDPQQKFNRFLHSLLDALLGPEEEKNSGQQSRHTSTRPVEPPPQTGPAFNFYYHLELEKSSSPYIRGKDGVYRKNPAAAGRRRKSTY